MLQSLNLNMIDYRRVCDKDAQPFNLVKIGWSISYVEQLKKLAQAVSAQKFST